MREKVRANRDREVTYDRIEGRVQRILYRRENRSIGWEIITVPLDISRSNTVEQVHSVERESEDFRLESALSWNELEITVVDTDTITEKPITERGCTIQADESCGSIYGKIGIGN